MLYLAYHWRLQWSLLADCIVVDSAGSWLAITAMEILFGEEHIHLDVVDNSFFLVLLQC
jgi:hypothetical protein